MEQCVLFLLSAVVTLVLVQSTAACNEALCASMVSKCILLKSCECDMTDIKNCTCCRDCHKCLSKLYTECCDCVGMCPQKTFKDTSYKTSTVEVLEDPIPDLFDALTEEEVDEDMRWTTYKYPAHLDLLYFKPKGTEFDVGTEFGGPTEGHRVRHGGHNVFIEHDSKAMNCTVAYMADCMSLSRCRASCESMGAARYRWFHQHGCCECIGNRCLEFGKGEPLCINCPPKDDVTDEELDAYYYDEYEDATAEDEVTENDEEIDLNNLEDASVKNIPEASTHG